VKEGQPTALSDIIYNTNRHRYRETMTEEETRTEAHRQTAASRRYDIIMTSVQPSEEIHA